ncbi:MAG: flagellar motor protein MotB [Thermodesulfovibrionales bacterium]
MADKSKTVIIKKVKKGHGGHHGGAWKVAYADFVTAMMAFFLLLWLLTMTSSEKRAVLAQYFKNFSIFQEAGKSFMKESSQILQSPSGDLKSSSRDPGMGTELTAEDLKEKLKRAIEQKLKGLSDQVLVDIFEGGVRIQLVDSEGKPMFYPGSAELSPSAKALLKLVSENIRDMLNRVAVEGHTDAAPLLKGQTTNWELSTARASSARRELESDGIDSNRVARVVGYADTELLIKENPRDPRNRRISIILLQPTQKEPLKNFPVRQEAVPERKPAERAPLTPAASNSPQPAAAHGQGEGRTPLRPELDIRPQKPILLPGR